MCVCIFSIFSVMVRLQTEVGAKRVWRCKDAARTKRSYMAAGYCGATNTDLQTTTSCKMCNYFHLLFFLVFLSLSLSFPTFFITLRGTIVILMHTPADIYSCTISKYDTDLYQTFSISYNIFFLVFNIAIDGLSRFQSLFAVECKGKKRRIFTVHSH